MVCVDGRGDPVARDTQRARLYRAEGRAFRSALAPSVRHFATIQAAARWLRRQECSVWWRRTFPLHRPILVRQLRAGSRAHGWHGHIELPNDAFGRRLDVVLHEAAHALTAHATAAEGWHGRTFARTYLRLVRHYLGVAAGRRLVAAYRQERVKYRRVPVARDRPLRPAAETRS